MRNHDEQAGRVEFSNLATFHRLQQKAVLYDTSSAQAA